MLQLLAPPILPISLHAPCLNQNQSETITQVRGLMAHPVGLAWELKKLGLLFHASLLKQKCGLVKFTIFLLSLAREQLLQFVIQPGQTNNARLSDKVLEVVALLTCGDCVTNFKSRELPELLSS